MNELVQMELVELNKNTKQDSASASSLLYCGLLWTKCTWWLCIAVETCYFYL